MIFHAEIYFSTGFLNRKAAPRWLFCFSISFEETIFKSILNKPSLPNTNSFSHFKGYTFPNTEIISLKT